MLTLLLVSSMLQSRVKGIDLISIVKLIELWRVRQTGHVAHMEAFRNLYIILVRKPEQKGFLRDLAVAGKTTLKCFVHRWGMRISTQFNWLRTGFIDRVLCIQFQNFGVQNTKECLNQLSNYQLLVSHSCMSYVLESPYRKIYCE
jgi:hypothetical protein